LNFSDEELQNININEKEEEKNEEKRKKKHEKTTRMDDNMHYCYQRKLHEKVFVEILLL